MEEIHDDRQPGRTKRPRLHNATERNVADWDERSPPTTTCALEPWVNRLTMTCPSECKSSLNLLQRIRSILAADDEYHKQESMIGLRRVLTIRLGCVMGHRTENLDDDNDNQNDIAKLVVLSVQCFCICYQRYPSNDSEAVVAFDTVLQLLKQGFDTVDGSFANDEEYSMLFYHSCLDLFHIWFLGSQPSLVFALAAHSNGHSKLEEMILTLNRLAQSQPVLTDKIILLFQRCCHDTTSEPAALFRIAIDVLERRDSVMLDDDFNCTDQTWLFGICCRVSLGCNHPLSTMQFERLFRILERGGSHCCKSLEVLKSKSPHLPSVQRNHCIRTLAHLLLEIPNSRSSLRAEALMCLNQLLADNESSDSNLFQTPWLEDFLEWCSEVALGDLSECSLAWPPGKLSDRDAAASILVQVIRAGMHLDIHKRQRIRCLETMAHILLVPFEKQIITRAIQSSCEWIHQTETRTVVIRLCPAILVSMAHLVCRGHASEQSKLVIVKSFWKILDTEKESSLIARESKILESIVTMASLKSSSVPSSIGRYIQNVAMTILLCLSENPIHRRLLAKHPGLLSTMIHFVRQVPTQRMEEEHETHEEYQVQPHHEMKQRILLLAKAL